eukprot:Rmarinus@m.24249
MAFDESGDWVPENWKYLAEGGENIVMSYCGPCSRLKGKVIRIRKIPTQNQENTADLLARKTEILDVGDGLSADRLRAEDDFIEQIMAPLLGKSYVHSGWLEKIPSVFLTALHEEVEQCRPRKRRKRARIDSNSEFVRIMDDLTIFPNVPQKTPTPTSRLDHAITNVHPNASKTNQTSNSHFCIKPETSPYPSFSNTTVGTAMTTRQQAKPSPNKPTDPAISAPRTKDTRATPDPTSATRSDPFKGCNSDSDKLMNSPTHSFTQAGVCKCSISVEIKPKCGFLPCKRLSGVISNRPVYTDVRHPVKSRVCRYCMFQPLKLHEGDVSHMSSYCPLDLFSLDRTRMRRAVTALSMTPYNNLRAFHDGTPLSMLFPSTDPIPHAVVSSERFRDVEENCVWTTKLLYDAVVGALAKDGTCLRSILRTQLLDRFDIEGIYRLYLRTIATNPHLSMADLLARPPPVLSPLPDGFHQSCFGRDRLATESKSTDSYDWQGQLCGCGSSNVESAVCEIEREVKAALASTAHPQGASPPDSSHIRSRIDLNPIPNNASGVEMGSIGQQSHTSHKSHKSLESLESLDARLDAIRDFVVSAVAKDCSILISFRVVDETLYFQFDRMKQRYASEGRTLGLVCVPPAGSHCSCPNGSCSQENASLPRLHCGCLLVAYAISIADVAMKNLHKIPKWHEVDETVVHHFVNSYLASSNNVRDVI